MFVVPVFADESCTEGVDCMESINANTYDSLTKIDEIHDYFGVTSSPISMFDKSDFDDNMSEFLQVFGMFSGLMLFGTAFNLGLWIYKR